jgi:hypothetical protein
MLRKELENPMAKTVGLIEIKKGDEVLEINPKTWPQHKALGWELVNPEDVEGEQPGSSPGAEAPKTVRKVEPKKRQQSVKGKTGKEETPAEKESTEG